MVGFSKKNGLPLISSHTDMIKRKLPAYHYNDHDRYSSAFEDPSRSKNHNSHSHSHSHSSKNRLRLQQAEDEGGHSTLVDELPPYTCTVYKMGYVKIKQETGSQPPSSSRIRWRKFYIRLWGTALYMYKNKDETKPVYTLSMQRVEAGLAPEFHKKPSVLRLRAATTGDQFLMRLMNTTDMVSWIEHLQAAANISLDLDTRKMPRFVTMTRPNNQSTTTANLTLSMGNRTVVTVCRYEGRVRLHHCRNNG
ncbi:hypothetical protein BDB00DRAFT_805231 [Zychaea mexicana]|uniref:uncharacterized protein n=1 Tax=Zychaea mexicana TaxID=64656 RepID=UPI0022FE48FF|nr:uncharacterized protein BDB00DRAFT_805231 [Zychaea mexicana]KAI9497158.1 hypothetical protein BDB00DRAFT_805231 [Zychaea mexicana]